MGYFVVLNYDLSKLIEAVNKLMREGWVCQGGVSVSVDSHSSQYYFLQAMIHTNRITK
ncbi:MAG: DUF1737 domain-containing protein [Parcubacteria group bacterium]|nr:DUF1737 domain-containing protein [Parcubacteria group bacterium]